jgi:hypothetical protein
MDRTPHCGDCDDLAFPQDRWQGSSDDDDDVGILHLLSCGSQAISIPDTGNIMLGERMVGPTASRAPPERNLVLHALSTVIILS